MPTSTKSAADPAPADEVLQPSTQAVTRSGPAAPVPVEIGGREGPEPTRFGDWEKSGRCIDF